VEGIRVLSDEHETRPIEANHVDVEWSGVLRESCVSGEPEQRDQRGLRKKDLHFDTDCTVDR
jgi:hypothetical protein